jgi:hypothetical protein
MSKASIASKYSAHLGISCRGKRRERVKVVERKRRERASAEMSPLPRKTCRERKGQEPTGKGEEA